MSELDRRLALLIAAIQGSRPRWQNRGACRSGGVRDLFFADHRGARAEVEVAKAICAVCPVRPACLAYAVTNHQRHGVWGGLTEDERRPLRAAFVVASGSEAEPEVA